MTAPPVRSPAVASTTAHAITVCPGDRYENTGKRFAFTLSQHTTPAAQLADLLARIKPSVDAWWSAHTWEGDKRAGDQWQAAAAIVVDADYHDSAGKHAAPSPETRQRIELAAIGHELPGNVFHSTPRGLRVVFVPPHPVTDAELYGRALEGAFVIVQRALETLGLHARPNASGRIADGYRVDESGKDLARVMFAPRAIVNGEHRNADVHVMRAESWSVDELAAAAPPLVPKPPPAPRRASRSSVDFAEAAKRWNADHAEDWGRGGGECPACGHKGCFGRLPLTPERWSCFSGNHEADSGGVGLMGKGNWNGDALDLEAHRRKLTPVEVLRADGYLADAKPRTRARATDSGRRRPTIIVRAELAAVTDEAEAALLADADAGIYVRAQQLVRIVRDTGETRRGLTREPDAPVIQFLPVEALRERIDLAAEWERRVPVKPKKDAPEDAPPEYREIPALPPSWVAPTLAARGAWPFPYLEGVIEAPTMKVNGELLDAPGYDADSGLMLIPSGRFPAIPAHPTRQDVLAAVARLLAPFADFPFLDSSAHSPEIAATLAAVLSLVGRHAIDGCVPMFTPRAPTPGTGKSLLVDVVCLIGTGRVAARMTMPRDDSELRKVILAVALEGSSTVLIDNVDGPLGSQSLAAAITTRVHEGRLLGATTLVRAPLRAVWFATGNGLTFRGDLGRRVLPIDMDAGVEHPEDREGFTHPDLVAWTRENRPQLVAAALTLLRAYHVAGRPKHGKSRMGGFEAWDDLVRGACIWAGLGDPFAVTTSVRLEDDMDLSALGAALEAWRQAFGATPKTAAQAVAALESNTPLLPEPEHNAALRDALRAGLLGLTGKDKLDSHALGVALRRVKGRLCGHLRFAQDGKSHGVALWTVKETG